MWRAVKATRGIHRNTKVHLKRICAFSAIMVVVIEVTLLVYPEASAYVAMIAALLSAVWINKRIR